MPTTEFKTVDEYITAQPEPTQMVLRRMRRAIRKALPKSEEVISYKVPAYKVRGRIILYFAGWKQHYSLYPAGERLIAAFRTELESCSVGKGTIRFSLSEPVPVELIEHIARFRAREVTRREDAKPVSHRPNS